MKVCPICGNSFKDIVKTQAFGCPECYFAFSDEIKQNFQKLGITESYKGSLPKNIKGFESNLVARVEVQLKLDEAVKKEEYEKAAFYRDYLQILNSKKINGEDSLDGKKTDK